MNKDDLLKMIPEAGRIKESLEKNLKKNNLKAVSKNHLVTITINYQQEITDIVIDNRLLDPGKAGKLKSSLMEAANSAIKESRGKMLEEAARTMKLF